MPQISHGASKDDNKPQCHHQSPQVGSCHKSVMGSFSAVFHGSFYENIRPAGKYPAALFTVKEGGQQGG